MIGRVLADLEQFDGHPLPIGELRDLLIAADPDLRLTALEAQRVVVLGCAVARQRHAIERAFLTDMATEIASRAAALGRADALEGLWLLLAALNMPLNHDAIVRELDARGLLKEAVTYQRAVSDHFERLSLRDPDELRSAERVQ